MDSLPDLSIVIVNWNTAAPLEQCLDSVFRTVQGLALEVVVVDNASTDDSTGMVRREFPTARLIENSQNHGFARANNQGIEETCGRNVLLLNSDAVLIGDAAVQMVRVLEHNPRLGILGPSLYYPDGRPQLCHRPLPTLATEIKSLFGLDKRIAHAVVPTPDDWVETGVVSGACLLARRAVFAEIGLLDESLVLFNEEDDLCLRAQLAGWKVAHLPAARVVHQRGASTGQSAQRILMLYRGKRRFFAKHFGPAAERRLLVAMRLAAFVKLASYSLARRLTLGRVRKDDFWRAVAQEL